MRWGKKRNKYGNQKISHAGFVFDSKAEKALFDRYSLEERAGAIRDLKSQPGTVYLTEARVQYRPDFSFIDCQTEEICWAEYKGYPTQSWAIKKRLWKKFGPGKLFIWGGSVSCLRLMETLNPKGNP